MKVNVCILQSDGTNCDNELYYAFEKAGGKSAFVHINELRTKKKNIKDFQVLALPGGFSYGDDIASGKVLAIELMSFFKDDLQKFVAEGGFVLGICNGFQTLVRTGLLPFNTLGSMQATLTHNDSGHFECRWVKIKSENSKASYFNDLNMAFDVAVNHGEGKFFADEKTLQKIEDEGLIPFRYVNGSGKPTMDYPANPNGALHSIAGITNKTGRILGLMPHPEKFVDVTQHPNWRRMKIDTPHGLLFFENIVKFVSGELPTPKRITYESVGDNYETKDPIKKLFQTAAAATGKNLKRSGFAEVSDTRGESAYVWQQGNIYMASVTEGLGTKNLIADAMRKVTGKTYYDSIAHDTVATIINDLVTVGAKPLVIHAYWSIEDNSWLQDTNRMTDLITGWKNACDMAAASWGGGETATMKGITEKNTADLAGCAVGIIQKKKYLLTDKKLREGDRILLLKSNGVNANGISLTRAVAQQLPKGYATKLSNGKMYGEELLTKTNIYATLIQDLLNNGINLHYISNITGHGLRKIMRARANFTYVIEKIFDPQEIFLFIQKHANLDDETIYATYNMGMDYALFLPEKDVMKAQRIIRKNKFESLNAGYIEKGERQVIIQPKNITYTSERLDLR